MPPWWQFIVAGLLAAFLLRYGLIFREGWREGTGGDFWKSVRENIERRKDSE